jgi:hypothetical protein
MTKPFSTLGKWDERTSVPDLLFEHIELLRDF